jgi:hypothetical protein
MNLIAIDPGWSGAIAVRLPNGLVDAYYSPDTIAEIASLIRHLRECTEPPYTAIIEKVHSMPGNGVVSTWKFAQNTAAWKAALAYAQIPFTEIPPKKWMKQLPCGVSKDKKTRKNQIKAYAQQMFPQIKVTLKNADALAMLTTMSGFGDTLTELERLLR